MRDPRQLRAARAPLPELRTFGDPHQYLESKDFRLRRKRTVHVAGPVGLPRTQGAVLRQLQSVPA